MKNESTVKAFLTLSNPFNGRKSKNIGKMWQILTFEVLVVEQNINRTNFKC